MIEEITNQLTFPEGPIAMADGSVIVVDIPTENLIRVGPDGEVEVIAKLGGGPNGAAIGPDGRCYICNNGGGLEWITDKYGTRTRGLTDGYSGGRIERVNLETGDVEVLYTHAGDMALQAPNDLVFDCQGGFWFTDSGKRQPTCQEHGCVYYATIDGKHIERQVHQMHAPNGVGLSPDEKFLYVSETETGRLFGFDIQSPGRIKRRRFPPSINGGFLVSGVSSLRYFDSLALDEEGNILIGSLLEGGITSISPSGDEVSFFPMPDILVTNLCFGGEDLKTVYVTLGASGRLIKMPWPTAGLPLNFLNK